jgi:hypothetical protein
MLPVRRCFHTYLGLIRAMRTALSSHQCASLRNRRVTASLIEADAGNQSPFINANFRRIANSNSRTSALLSHFFTDEPIAIYEEIL